jgi:hypothetical protein
MSEGPALKRLLATLVVAAIAAALPAAAAADTPDIIAPQHTPPTAEDGWQAGTCTTDTPPCSPQTPDQFYTQAAGHPPVGLTQFIVKYENGFLGGKTPVGDLKTLWVDLPVGLSVNPQATPQCQLAEGASPATCPLETAVGTSLLEAALVILGTGQSMALPAVPVYNIVPKQGQPARFGFSVLGNDVFLEGGIAWESDFHEFFKIDVPKLELPSIPGIEGVRVLRNRLTFNGRAGNGTFLTNPSTCLNPALAPNQHVYSTFLRADSYQGPNPSFPSGSTPFEAALPPGVMPTGCAQVPFAPSTAVTPNTNQTDSPSGPTVEANVPFEAAPTAIANSNVRDANVTLPVGMGLNPAAAPKLEACRDEQLHKNGGGAVACPAGSKIGTVAIETPPLPAGSLTGNVYLATQQSRDPASGNLYRLFIAAESSRYDVAVRLVGNVKADPQTGQLTTTVRESPQVPFSSVKIQFDGSKGVLTTPPTCGPNKTTHAMTSWSGTPDQGPADKGFTLSSAPGGGACAKTLAERPFSPSFKAGSKSTGAAAFTPFSVNITRPDGQQELKAVDITLPPGATAKLAGVPYCPPAAIAAAAGQSGRAERSKASCPGASQVGVATVAAGSGSSPLQIDGKAYLAGPYKGAPLSLAVVTPAVAGPFDLGTVVVRVALFLDPETAQIHAVSDPIPDVFGGAKLDIRSVAVNVNKADFTLTGTNCAKFATAGALKGGGADPANPAAFSSFPVSDPLQLNGCERLKFRPKLNLRLFGATKRAKHPRLRAVLKARAGDANIARASVGLPHALFLDQASLATICTRVQFAANECPKKSAYGRARAFTPLLGQPLEGPVYLRSSNNPLPDLVAHLQGQVDIDLVGRIDSFKGGVRTTFARVPDVPVSKFVMTLPGGKHGLLVASRDLCKGKKVKAVIQLKGQNGKKANKRTKLRTPCHKKHGGKRHKGKGQGGQR